MGTIYLSPFSTDPKVKKKYANKNPNNQKAYRLIKIIDNIKPTEKRAKK